MDSKYKECSRCRVVIPMDYLEYKTPEGTHIVLCNDCCMKFIQFLIDFAILPTQHFLDFGSGKLDYPGLQKIK